MNFPSSMDNTSFLSRLLRPVQQLALHSAKNTADVMVSLLIVAVVFVLILPLPTMLVDVLIGMNLGLSALLLVVAMYLPGPLGFSAFPSVLLITTLFRLSLSISTTRLILLQADAGHIVQTFGDFVVGGNLVVGLTVFLILTIVQFIVITKGGERVAEVAARFTLDAMPGKQMSIDSDMRAGVITMQEARQRRQTLERESQLFGAMDGAMKFVKGDAIASIVIVAVNLLGGLLIGVLQQGLSAGEATKVYSVLTIGDGLVAQIPALFISITAGIIITRVSNDEKDSERLGQQIVRQVSANPAALLIAGLILFMFAWIPGMPTPVLMPLGLGVFALGYRRVMPARRHAGDGEEEPHAIGGAPPAPAAGGRKGEAGADDTLVVQATTPLILELAHSLRSRLDADDLLRRIQGLRRSLYRELGVPYPSIQLRFSSNLASNAYEFLLHEVPVARGYLQPDHVIARCDAMDLQTHAIAHERRDDFLPGVASLWVPREALPQLATAGLPFMDVEEILGHHVSCLLRRYAGEFMGLQESRTLFASLEAKSPDLVKELNRVMAPQRISEVMMRLASEGVSIRNIRAIAEALIEWGQKEKDPVILTEHIRGSLKRHVSHRYAQGRSVSVYLLSPEIEENVRQAIRQTSAGSYLAMDPQMHKQILARIKDMVGTFNPLRPPVLLTAMDVRRYIRKMVEPDLFELPVVSFQEIASDMTVHPLGRIEMK